MKAIIHGISVEGTPQEIMEYKRMQDEKVNKVSYPAVWAEVIYTPKCPNEGKPCFCTGACRGQDSTANPTYFTVNV